MRHEKDYRIQRNYSEKDERTKWETITKSERREGSAIGFGFFEFF